MEMGSTPASSETVPSSYLAWLRVNRKTITDILPAKTPIKEVMALVGKKWKSLSAEERAPFDKLRADYLKSQGKKVIVKRGPHVLTGWAAEIIDGKTYYVHNESGACLSKKPRTKARVLAKTNGTKRAASAYSLYVRDTFSKHGTMVKIANAWNQESIAVKENYKEKAAKLKAENAKAIKK
jgi:hypothetical protein